MGFELVVIQGRSISSTLKLGDGVTTIGRHDECQLRIKSSQVSRKHCELFEKKGHLLVKDLGSSNGTIVNGKKVQGQRVLEPGDELSIGPILLRVVKSEVAGPASPAGPGKPGETAVSAPPVAVSTEGDPDGFAIEIDVEEPAQAPNRSPTIAPLAKTVGPVQDDDAIADFLMDLPIDGDEPTQTTPASKGSAAKPTAAATAAPAPATVNEPASPKAEPASNPAPTESPQSGVSDDAIADFLLDIKIDEE